MRRRAFAVLILGASLLGGAACGGAEGAPRASHTSRPADAYTAYVAAIGNATAVNELYQHLSRAQRKRTAGLETLKAGVPAGVLKIKDEKIEGDKATVIVAATVRGKEGKEEPATGTISLVREEGEWKVDQESWAR